MNEFSVSESLESLKPNPSLAEMFNQFSETAFHKAQAAFSACLGRGSGETDARAGDGQSLIPLIEMPVPDHKGGLSANLSLPADIIRIDDIAREAAIDRYHERAGGAHRGRASAYDDRGL